MEVSIYSFMIICPLVFIAGFVDAIAGGGGLISLPAYLIGGIPPHLALGTNKLSSTFGTFIATIRYYKNNAIIMKTALFCAGMALIGSFVGANIALVVSEEALGYMMLIILPILAIYILKGNSFKEDRDKKKLSKIKTLYIGGITSFVIGTYDGFYGPGTGTFLVLIYTGLLGMDIKIASGNAKVVNLASNIAALVTFLLNGKMVIGLGLTAALFSIAGNYIGAGLVVKNGLKIVRPIVISVIVLLFIKIIYDYSH